MKGLIKYLLIAAILAGVAAFMVNQLTLNRAPSTVSGADYLRLLKGEWVKALKLNSRGYDTAYAEYLLIKSRVEWREGSLSKAIKYLRMAEELLSNPLRLPNASRPIKAVAVRSETINELGTPTAWDFIPLNKVFVVTGRGYLDYPYNDFRGWVLSCFILGAIGHDASGNLVIYQGRLPLKPSEGFFTPKLYYRGKWYVPRLVFAGPLYVKNVSGGVMVYEPDITGRYVESLTYYPSKRLWVHEVVGRGGNVLLNITAVQFGQPMWLGRWGEFLVHGAYPRVKAFDLWGGFWVIGRMNASLRIEGRVVRFKGYLVIDRASHRVLGEGGLTDFSPLAFSCIAMYSGNASVMITSSTNPSPLKPPVRFEHQLRVCFNGLTLSTTNFTLSDNGGLQPSRFWVKAWFPNGYLILNGSVVTYWPSKWAVGRGAWWGANVTYSWGRAFIHWVGELVVNGSATSLNAVGMGEFTRCLSNSTAVSGGSPGCWCSPKIPTGNQH